MNIVGDTLQSLDGPEMLPLIADQTETEASVMMVVDGDDDDDDDG